MPFLPERKEKPLTSLVSMGGGAAGMQFGGLSKDSPYIEELFSSYVYRGNSGTQTVSTGIDMTKGGMVWYKNRTDNSTQNIITDTERGVDKVLYSDAGNGSTDTTLNQSFTNTGWSFSNSYGDTNQNNKEYVSWNFRKRKGFFDIQTWSGNSTAGRQISHDLETIPGCIMVKRTDAGTSNWIVYHRSLGNNRGNTGRDSSNVSLNLNSYVAQDTSIEFWNDTLPTKDNFTLGIHPTVNQTGGTYIAYIFAHGDTGAGQYTTGLPTSHVKSPNGVYTSAINPPTMSTGPFGVANTALTFNGSGEHPYTVIASPSMNHGNNDFTYECWFKGDSATWGRSWSMLMSRWQDYGIYIGLRASGYCGVYDTTGTSNSNFNLGWQQDTWHHLAVVRSGSTVRVLLDGENKTSFTDNENYDNKYSNLDIGSSSNTGGKSQEEFTGQISNVRVTVGQAIYWADFTPATSNLTLTSQGADPKKVIFLGLNGAANPDYEEAHKFGEDEDEYIVKCGSYVGAAQINVICGFEPQLLFIKGYTSNVNSNCDWLMIDKTRGLTAGAANEAVLRPNKTDNEQSYDNLRMSTAAFTDVNNSPLGFTGTGGYDNSSNSGNGPYIYIAIRKKDGKVGKPAESGTDVFAIANGSGSTDMDPPNFTSNFPVDMGMWKVTSSGTSWALSTKLTQGRELSPNQQNGETDNGNNANMVFDSNIGWNNFQHWTTNGVSWMWQNNQGFDVVTFRGSASNRSIQHSLGRTPEMMIVKNRSADQWNVWFSSFNDASSILKLNSDQQITGSSAYWWQQPTATHFSVGAGGETNSSSYTFLALLFATVPKISKVGSYTGNGLTGASGPFLATGFQPRYIIIRRAGGANADNGYSWRVHDSFRGMTNWLAFNSTNGNNGEDAFTLSSEGIRVKTDNGAYNTSGANYVYYAHA